MPWLEVDASAHGRRRGAAEVRAGLANGSLCRFCLHDMTRDPLAYQKDRMCSRCAQSIVKGTAALRLVDGRLFIGHQSVEDLMIDRDFRWSHTHEGTTVARGVEPLLDEGVVSSVRCSSAVDGCADDLHVCGDGAQPSEHLVLSSDEVQVEGSSVVTGDGESSSGGGGADGDGELDRHDSSSSVGGGAPAVTGAGSGTPDPTEEEAPSLTDLVKDLADALAGLSFFAARREADR